MQSTTHTMHDLFGQLGLPNEEADVQSFIDSHRPLPDGMLLADAPFWSPAQSQFLKEEFRGDADWAEVVDQLNVALHD